VVPPITQAAVTIYCKRNSAKRCESLARSDRERLTNLNERFTLLVPPKGFVFLRNLVSNLATFVHIQSFRIRVKVAGL
jgi:hypothetical protein